MEITFEVFGQLRALITIALIPVVCAFSMNFGRTRWSNATCAEFPCIKFSVVNKRFGLNIHFVFN